MNKIAFVLLFIVNPLLTAERPNILFILTDDQRPDTIHALGNNIIETPNLDRLVKSGTVFTRAHCGSPLCVPSRAEILTGTSAFTNGTLLRGGKGLKKGLTFWPEAMKNAGYRTWYVGKWHTAGRPTTRGYVKSNGLFASGGGKFWKPKVDYKGDEVTGYRGWIFQNDERKLFPEKGIGLTQNISKHFADAAIELINRKSDEPFFLHVNFTAPHDPLLYPTGYNKKYDPKKMPLPTNYKPRHPFDHGNYEGRDEKMLPWPRTKDAVQKNIAVYYSVISHMDAQIGRIIDSLKKSGQDKNTIIIFASDHGLATGSHGLMGKQNMYEHTILVPLIFAGPGIPKGEKRNAFVYLRDLFPTVCEMTSTKIPKSVESKSFHAVIQGKSKDVHKQAFGYFTDTQRMVRNQEWKLIYYPKAKRTQLFHLATDPFELKNLANVKKHQATRQKLEMALHQWQRTVNDPILPTQHE